MADYTTTGKRILLFFAGGCSAQHPLSNGIRYVPVASKPRKSLSALERIFIVALVIFYSMADYSTNARLILILFAGDCWARCQPPNGIRYISFASKLGKSLSSVEGVLGITRKVTIFYSMADYSTTTRRILILFAGDCWAQRRLPNGIWYISVPSELKKSLSSVEGVLGIQFVRGPTGPRKTRAPSPFPRPAPLNGLEWAVIFSIPCPSPRSCPNPTHSPRRVPAKNGS